jgi:Secretion system C-terminal sorting domain
MKKTLLRSLLFVCLIGQLTSSAQVGWQWGIKNTGKGGMEAWPLAVDASGNAFACGNSFSGTLATDSMTFGTHKVYNPGHYSQLIITKSAPAGNFLWAIGSQNAHAGPLSAATDPSGNLFVVGNYSGSTFTLGTITLTNSSPYVMYFIAKVSAAGTVLWAQNICNGTSGGPVISFSVGTDGTGNAYVTGNFYQYNVLLGTSILVNHDNTGFTCDILLAKYSPTGIIRWAKSFGGNHADFPFIGTSYPTNFIAVTTNGNIYLNGQFYSDSIKLGATTLYNPYGGTTIPGPTYSYITKIDSNGYPFWAKYIARNLNIGGLATNGREQLFICGALYLNDTLGTTPLAPGAVVSKFDSAGNNLWGKSASGGSARGIGLDNSGNVFWTGPINDSMNFASHILNKPAGSVDPVFVAQYDTSGNYVASVGVRSGGDDACMVVPDNMGNYYLLGDFFGTPLVFGPSTLDSALIVSETIFLAKYRYIVPSGISQLATSDFILYPNPAGNKLTIAASEDINSIIIYDISGRIVISDLAGQSHKTAQINIAHLPVGMYLAKINNGVTKKFVKQ